MSANPSYCYTIEILPPHGKCLTASTLTRLRDLVCKLSRGMFTVDADKVVSYREIQWYSDRAHLGELSNTFPNHILVMTAVDDRSGDPRHVWKYCAKNGKIEDLIPSLKFPNPVDTLTSVPDTIDPEELKAIESVLSEKLREILNSAASTKISDEATKKMLKSLVNLICD